MKKTEKINASKSNTTNIGGKTSHKIDKRGYTEGSTKSIPEKFYV